MNYTITKNVTKATHWIAYEDYAFPASSMITPRKLYNIELIDEEYVIKDDSGRYSLIYLVHNGDLIIVDDLFCDCIHNTINNECNLEFKKDQFTDFKRCSYKQ